MESRTVIGTQSDDSGRIVGVAEIATIVHEGREFTNLGASVTPDHAVGYVQVQPGHWELTDWNGDHLGFGRSTSKWKTPGSFVSSHYYQARFKINGVWYTGRTAGHGMLWKGKRMTGRGI